MTPPPRWTKNQLKVAMQGGKQDNLHPELMTQSWHWAKKFADVHMVHSTIPKTIGELKPLGFMHHGTPEATLTNDIERGHESFMPAARWTNRLDFGICTSQKAYDLWKPFDWENNLHKVDKGIDLEWWKRSASKQDLEGEPSILYGEVWRGIKHPLHLMHALNYIYENHTDKVRLNSWGLANVAKMETKKFWTEFVDLARFDKFIGKRGMRGIEPYPDHWYSSGDVLAGPGLYGDVSRVRQEAMACGCPVVAWDTDIHKEMHAWKYAKAFDFRDFGDKLMDTYGDVADDRVGVARKTRAIAERYFDINTEAQQIVDILRDVVSNQ